MKERTLHISTSPHIKGSLSTEKIMHNVIWALLPVCAFAVYSFGLSALLLLFTSTLAAVVTEHLLCLGSKKPTTIGDGSAIITGLLLGLTLPPSFPLWMAMVGAIIAIALGKYAFGGLGYNVFNPALVGRVFLQAAFPVAITTWHPPFLVDRFEGLASSTLATPFMQPSYDVISGATPLSAFKFDYIGTDSQDLALGLISGSTGETCAWLILLGGLYLALRKMLNWRIPLAVFAGVVLLSGITYGIDPQNYPSPTFMLFSGGLMLGAVFMATDMVASPLSSAGVVIYGLFIGLLTVVIRLWAGLPEGVMYAILLANALSPHIDKLTQPRVYGTKRRGLS